MGVDLNSVTGRPELDPAAIADIVRGDGAFRSVHEIRRQFPIIGGDPIYALFDDEHGLLSVEDLLRSGGPATVLLDTGCTVPFGLAEQAAAEPIAASLTSCRRSSTAN